MRPKLLGKEHEYWLKENYTRYENPVLAEMLTEMVRRSNEKEHEELVKMLPSLSDEKLKEDVSKRILFLRNPVTITVANVKVAARRLHCPKKNLAVLSKVNRRSAQTRHIRRWVQLAVYVDKPIAWFRTLKLGKTYIAKFTGVKKMKNFLDYLIAWNRDEGIPKNIVLKAEPFKAELIVRIVPHVYINIDEV